MTTRAVVEVDLAAVGHNVALLLERANGAELCAVVKADGYGHGAVAVARAAKAAGAGWVAVAQAREAVALREAGIEGPVLLLSEPSPAEDNIVLDAELACVVYDPAGIRRLAASAAARRRLVPVHLKIDTGMRRVGAEPADAVSLARLVADQRSLLLQGVMTHCAVADEPANPFTAVQIERFDAVLAALSNAGFNGFLRHAANSAALMVHANARYDLVRPGIALYGVAPSDALAGAMPLRRVLSLRTAVSFMKKVRAGEGLSYGLAQSVAEDTVVATVPIGYADGVRRGLGVGRQCVLIGGRRCPILGVVTMDQLMVDCGPKTDAASGDEVVLIGEQGTDEIRVEEWANVLGTICYEVLTGLGGRLDRVFFPGT